MRRGGGEEGRRGEGDKGRKGQGERGRRGEAEKGRWGGGEKGLVTRNFSRATAVVTRYCCREPARADPAKVYSHDERGD